MIDIRKLRERRGLTQQELADRCGVTLRTVQNWEGGRHIPDSTLIILELLGITEDSMKNISSSAKDNAVSVSAAEGSQVSVESPTKTETEKFISMLQKQQELIIEQSRSMAKRDEQIDRLISLLEKK